jgi:hypothetical protein
MVTWPDDIDGIIAGDLTAALAYSTPAGNAVLTPVAPIGMRDREQGTVTFTTSLGFGKKLERIRQNPRVALAYHSREHGFGRGDSFVLVQGDATPLAEPDQDLLENVIGPQSERFLGPRKRGRLFWNRWLRAYYSDRVPVTVRVERILAWSDPRGAAVPRTFGVPAPTTRPLAQDPPTGGAGPRLDAAQAAEEIGALPNQLLAWIGTDGYPQVRPVSIDRGGADGIRLTTVRGLPLFERRASLLAHRYNKHLVGLEMRGHTGWLTVAPDDPKHGLFAPHTQYGFRAPANKTLLLLANGLLARRGLRKARARQAA